MEEKQQDTVEQPAAQARWYVRHEQVARGPYTSIQIRRLLLAETLSTSDMVSTDRERWQPMQTVPEVVPPELRNDAVDFEAELAEEAGQMRRQARVGMLLVMLVLAAGFGLTLYLDASPEVVVDCAAPPAPGVDWRECRFAALAAPAAQLSGVRLSNAVLPRARLQAAVMKGGDLGYADLQGADLSYADLSEARLVGADLRGADLTYADLRGADLSFTDLRGARLGGARLEGARLQGAVWLDGSRCPSDAVGSCSP